MQMDFYTAIKPGPACGEWVGDGGEAAVVSQGLKEICFGTPIFCCFLFKNIFFYLEIIFDDRSETEIAQRVPVDPTQSFP